MVAALALAVWMAPVTASAQSPFKLLALGDSLTAGWGLPDRDGLTPQLAAALKAQGLAVTVINAGVSGDTTAGGLARLAWALADKPDAAMVALGANDMLRGIDPAIARANLDAILTQLKQAGVPVLLVGMRASPSWGADYVQRFDAIYPELAALHGVALHPFLLDGVAGDPTLNQGDGIHPNAKGVARIVAHLTPPVMALIQGAAQTHPIQKR